MPDPVGFPRLETPESPAAIPVNPDKPVQPTGTDNRGRTVYFDGARLVIRNDGDSNT